jgi:hypothetical protein
MLLSAAEAAFTMLAALSPLMADYVLSACEYGLSAVSADGEWPLALGGVLGWVLFYHFVITPIDPARQRQQTPYTLLGVTTDSSHREITEAYYRMIERARRTGHYDLARAQSELLAYRGAYETLTDPLLRCIYHRDAGTPDWYGVPKLCWGELAVDRLQSAKTATRHWTGPEDAFARMPMSSMHPLTERLYRCSRPLALVLATSSRTALISAGSTQIHSLTREEKYVSLSAELEIVKNAVLDYLQGFNKQSLVALKNYSASAFVMGVQQWVTSNPRHSLSIAVLIFLTLVAIAFYYWDRWVVGPLTKLVAFSMFLPMVMGACFSSSTASTSLARWRLEHCLSGAARRTIWEEMLRLYFAYRWQYFYEYRDEDPDLTGSE